MAIEKSKSIGGLYNKVSQKGLDYLNGFITIEGKRHKIVAFKNNNKVNETSPDYSIYISEPMGATRNESQSQPVHANQNSGSEKSSDPFGFED